MKYKIGLCIFWLLAISFCGCGNESINRLEGEEKMKISDVKENDNVKFMTETYGFSEEELYGIDLEKLISDYELRTRDYTAEEIREILDSESDMYLDDGMTQVLSIFSKTGRKLKKDDQIQSIGFYLNSGTLKRFRVFDLENQVYYVDSAEERNLSQEQAETLRALPEKWDLYSWESHYEGREEESTGNYSWKLVFKVSEDEFCVYDGYTKDMSHLPENFEEVKNEIEEQAN